MDNELWNEKITKRWFSYPTYDQTVELLKEHQQISIYKFDVLFIVALLGIIINIFSEYFINILTEGILLSNILPLGISLILLIGLIYFVNKKLSAYQPHEPRYVIQFNLEKLMQNELKNTLKEKEFYKKDFDLWYTFFEKQIIDLFTSSHFLQKYNYRAEEVEQYSELRHISLSSQKGVPNRIEIHTSPLEQSNKIADTIFYYDINFEIKFILSQSGVPEAIQYIDNIYAGTSLIMSKFENRIVESFATIS